MTYPFDEYNPSNNKGGTPPLKLRTYPFNVFSARLWFFDGNRPTNPLIASERRKVFPCCESFGI
jgi:hypothetical protein